MHSLRLRVLGLLILAACVLAVPAVASAAEGWQRLADPAPGGLDNSDLSFRVPDTAATVVGGTAYLSVLDTTGGVNLYRARPGDIRWQRIGFRRRGLRAPMGFATMAWTGRTAWLAWYELAANKLWHLHLATSNGGGFRGLAASSTGVAKPTSVGVVEYGGRDYVASSGSVARVSRNGRRLAPVDAGLQLVDGEHSVLTVADGRLYLVHGGDGTVVVSRLSLRGDAWETVTTAPGYWVDDAEGGPGALYIVIDHAVYQLTAAGTLEPLPETGWSTHQIEVVRGVLYAGGCRVSNPDAPCEFKLFAFENGTWRQLPAPVGPAPDTADFNLIGADSTLWMHWVSSPMGAWSYPRRVHVARLLR